jgi:hypothetical protein
LGFAHFGCAASEEIRAIHGRIQTAETGVPIAGATVIVQEIRPSKTRENLPLVVELARGTTSDNGSFALQVPARKYLALRVEGEECRWNGRSMRLDKISDLDAPLEIFLTTWECKGGG